MFQLKEVRPYEILRCQLTRTYMFGGDWYYEDDETGQIILYEAYHKTKAAEIENRFDYSRLLNAQSSTEYKEELKRYERETLEMNILNSVDQELRERE